MPETHLHTCTLCEATCGVVVTVDDGRVTAIRGDKNDPLSKGYLCAKGPALAELHHDPDRLRRPLIKTGARAGDSWREADWDEAFDVAAGGLRRIRKDHGRDALGVYYGNPTAHSLGLLTYGAPLFKALRSANTSSATSVDLLSHQLAAMEMLGHQLLIPIPDLDRTDLFICLGANPAASNGSLMTAPNVRGRLKAITGRGGRVVLIDPRRTESAALATDHHFIRPGADALMLLSMVTVLFAEDLVRTTRPVSGLDALRRAATDFPPERTAAVTGVEPEVVRDLARSLATTERAVIYGRFGVSTQEFGGLCAWLLTVLNAITGHLDEVGGAMFTTPAFDLVGMASSGSFDTRRSRVRGLPNFNDEMPAATLAEEIDTPGSGQVRGMLTVAGNPVLSTPNGARLERAMADLEFMASIDFYVNETTRFADVILPPTGHLERPHYDLLFPVLAVHNTARYVPAVFEREPDQRHDWEICAELGSRLFGPRLLRRPLRSVLGMVGPDRIVDLGLRRGPHGGRGGLTLKKLKASQSGVDLGPLKPRLDQVLGTKSKTVELVPTRYLDDLPRLTRRLAEGIDDGGLRLIGRRHLRSCNSWLHNSERLVSGRDRCTLLMHADDAAVRGLGDGEPATVTSAAGSVTAPVEVTDAVMPGVVSLPHGWGHHRAGIRLSVAADHAGVSANDVTDDRLVDELTGTAAVNGVPVTVSRAGADTDTVPAASSATS